MDRGGRRQPSKERTAVASAIAELAAKREAARTAQGLQLAAAAPLPGEDESEPEDEDVSAPGGAAGGHGSSAYATPTGAGGRRRLRRLDEAAATAGQPSAGGSGVDALLAAMQSATVSDGDDAPQPPSDGQGARRVDGGRRARLPPPPPAPPPACEGDADAAGDDAGADSSGGCDDDDDGGGAQQHAPPTASSSDAPAPEGAAALELEGGYRLEGKVAGMLYAHQTQGVRWLWGLHRAGRGGILGDDMGLGKTMQVAAFLAGLLRSGRGRRALIVAPKTLLAHWEAELRRVGLGPLVGWYYGSGEGERNAALAAVCREGEYGNKGRGVLLTTYGMVLHNAEMLMRPWGRNSAAAAARWGVEDDDDCADGVDEDTDSAAARAGGPRLPWDWLVLDEGHKLKNPRMQLAQRLRGLRTRVRLVISGTPIQNNLMELHALMTFTTPGLLGDARAFKTTFERPITVGQDRNAPQRARVAGAATADELRRMIAPYLLRREKKDVLAGAGDADADPDSGTNGGGGGGGAGEAEREAAAPTASSAAAAMPSKMGRKHDRVVWLRLTPLQRHIYEAFLNSAAVKAALNSSRSPLAALTVLKKVCDHPALLSDRAAQMVVAGGAAYGRRSGGGTGKAAAAGEQRPRRRDSLDDFIVDDDASEDGSDGRRESGASDGGDRRASSSESEQSSGRGAGADAAASSKAARRKQVAESIHFTDDWLSWADGDVERKLLEDLGRRRDADASAKSAFVVALLRELADAGHRTLVFSQSRVMLDILQAAITSGLRLPFCRIDGSVASADARRAEVARFQEPGADIPVFLLTSQVGGLGLTLTAADRVVLVDPSFNPAVDNQAVDRAYRIGQSQDVVVYRLITCGTVEEKIYRKQVFKGGLSRAGTEEGVQLRYFTHQELHEMFSVTPEGLVASETCRLLEEMHAAGGAAPPPPPEPVGAHLRWVEAQEGCVGTSDHGLLFSLKDEHAPKPAAQGAWGPGALLDAAAQLLSRSGRGPGRGGGAGSGSAGPAGDPNEDLLAALGGTFSGARRATVAPLDPREARAAELLGRMEQLHQQRDSAQTTLALVGPRLPDGGAKLRRRLEGLQAELAAAEADLRVLVGEAGAAAPADSAASAPAAVAHGVPRPAAGEPGGAPRGAPPPASGADASSDLAAMLGSLGLGARRDAARAERSADGAQPSGAASGERPPGALAPAGASEGVRDARSRRLPVEHERRGAGAGPAPPTAAAAAACGPGGVPAAGAAAARAPAESGLRRGGADAPPLPAGGGGRMGAVAATATRAGPAGVLGGGPSREQLLQRKSVLKRELWRLNDLMARARGPGGGGEALPPEQARALQGHQRRMHEEYKQIKALLGEQAPAAAPAAGHRQLQREAPVVVDLT